ncbi:MAG: prephenate dehydrogenase/arogenate dehydrogenase family protein [Actinomycetota bacterium]
MTSAERVAVLGTGLMGTSIALAAIRAGDTVRGFDADPEVQSRAAGRAGFEPCRTVAACVRDANLAFVCTPIQAIPSVAAQALVEAPDAVVSDAGSVKSHVVAEVQAKVSARNMSRFVGGHPMGGSERSGPEGASASVVDGIVWVLTPTAATDPSAVAGIASWVARIGSQPVRMDPERHDRLVALVSHLPQVASTALMGLAATEEAGEPEILLLAAGGFRDLTRLAASNPKLWSDILLSNREALATAIDLYVDRLVELRGLVKEGRAADVERSFAEAKRARLALAAKPQVKAGVALIQVPVPDRPGALAELTALLGGAAVNIEDLQIVHSPEGGRGTVHLTIAASSAEQALAALAAGGFPALRLA